MGLVRNIVDKTFEKIGYLNRKSWAAIWAKAAENLLYGDKIKQPYEQVPSVYKAVKALCDNVPQAELVFRDWDTQEESERDTVKPLEQLFRAPNPEESQNDFIQKCVGIFALNGQVIIEKVSSIGNETGATKVPAALYAYNPEQLTVKKDEAGHVLGWTVNKEKFIPVESAINVKDFSPYDNYCGTKPTTPIQRIMDIDLKSTLYNEAFFDNYGAPPFAITTDKNLTDAQRIRLEKWWKDRHEGVGNAHKVAILEAGLKPQSFGLSQKDMDFLEQKRFSREEILGNWRVPKAMFNITEDLNYATFQGQMKVFWLYALMPILRKFEDAFNRQIVMAHDKSLYLEFDTRTVPAFQDDLAGKMDTGYKAFQMGVPFNEVNEKLDLGFEGGYAWGDTWWIPFGLHPADEPVDMGTGGNNNNAPQDDTAKSWGTDFTPTLYRFWKQFVVKQMEPEAAYAKALHSFFFAQRGRIIAQFYQSNKSLQKKETSPININIDWDAENKALMKKSLPYLHDSVLAGMKFAKDSTSGVIDVAALNELAQALTTQRLISLKYVTDTTAKYISGIITSGISGGKTVQDIADEIRQAFNTSQSRSAMVARTEVTGSLNDGSLLYYKAAGVEEITWVTAGDEHVRESHRSQNGETVKAGTSFKNGLRFPGDAGPAEERINCRCTVVPVIK